MDRIVYCSNTAIKVYLFVCSLSFLYSWLKLTSVQINHKFKKILVAIDGSQESINAAGYAISIAKETTITAEKHSSELILLYVMPSGSEIRTCFRNIWYGSSRTCIAHETRGA